MPSAAIEARVREIAEMLDLAPLLGRKASRLTADAKQKISLGRGLVRSDVAAVLFDEPLTVIDPALKWQLRSKLKALHRALDLTMIYVTHDQTEALTFADTVVVMHDGDVVQTGTPEELFERPDHTFVGYFIGSPGMNVLPAEIRGRQPGRGSSARAGRGPTAACRPARGSRSASGPNSCALRGTAPGLSRPASSASTISGAADFAHVRLGDMQPRRARAARIRARGRPGRICLRAGPASTSMPTAPRRGSGVMEKIPNKKAWLLVLPVFALVAFAPSSR